MANPQPTDAHFRIAHSISEAIMMRNFSKRQRAILDLILRLSWGCGKKYAIIPRQRDFQLVGISETKIKDELEWLINAKVIEWHKQTNVYSFLKDFDKWLISIVPEYDRKRFEELLHINITFQKGKLLSEMVSQDTSNNENELDEKGRYFPKNWEVEQVENIDSKRGCSRSKESIKESNNIYTTEFEKFYGLYPNPQDKQRSFTNWKKRLKENTAEELILAAINYKKVVEKENRERQYIKSSANFVGQDKFYKDYIPKPVEVKTPLKMVFKEL